MNLHCLKVGQAFGNLALCCQSLCHLIYWTFGLGQCCCLSHDKLLYFNHSSQVICVAINGILEKNLIQSFIILRNNSLQPKKCNKFRSVNFLKLPIISIENHLNDPYANIITLPFCHESWLNFHLITLRNFNLLSVLELCKKCCGCICFFSNYTWPPNR